jgi:hypothetical protein
MEDSDTLTSTFTCIYIYINHQEITHVTAHCRLSALGLQKLPTLRSVAVGSAGPSNSIVSASSHWQHHLKKESLVACPDATAPQPLDFHTPLFIEPQNLRPPRPDFVAKLTFQLARFLGGRSGPLTSRIASPGKTAFASTPVSRRPLQGSAASAPCGGWRWFGSPRVEQPSMDRWHRVEIP